MGSNMVRRLLRAGHECVVFDQTPAAVQALAKEKATGVGSVADLVRGLAKPRTVWLMFPAAAVDDTIAGLAPHLEKGDTLIDGGNSYYVDDIRRAKALEARGIHYVDVGTSGGVYGLERGYCMTIRFSRRWRRAWARSSVPKAATRPRRARPSKATCTAGRAVRATS
jgi:6-phosphogluconate dehydrogenase